MADNIISGSDAHFFIWDGTTNVDIEETTFWSYQEGGTDPTYASGQSKGTRRRLKGTYDITGTVRGVCSDAETFRTHVKRGVSFVARFVRRQPVAAAGLTPAINGIYDEFRIRVLTVDTQADIDAGGTQPWSFTFGLDTDTANPTPLFDQVLPP
jgi:hypothetical protein